MAPPTVQEIFKEELAVYLHHQREKSPDGLFHMMQYSLRQQLIRLIRQDIRMYKMHVALHQDQKIDLISFPLCARFVGANSEAPLAFFEGNAKDPCQGKPQFSLRDQITLEPVSV
ncbi:hypothetical protein ACEPPN_007824 [Leptodophora sp. 'Broadleaf-Isolate-01']